MLLKQILKPNISIQMMIILHVFLAQKYAISAIKMILICF